MTAAPPRPNPALIDVPALDALAQAELLRRVERLSREPATGWHNQIPLIEQMAAIHDLAAGALGILVEVR